VELGTRLIAISLMRVFSAAEYESQKMQMSSADGRRDRPTAACCRRQVKADGGTTTRDDNGADNNVRSGEVLMSNWRDRRACCATVIDKAFDGNDGDDADAIDERVDVPPKFKWWFWR
jgi:hypothetical protein